MTVFCAYPAPDESRLCAQLRSTAPAADTGPVNRPAALAVLAKPSVPRHDRNQAPEDQAHEARFRPLGWSAARIVDPAGEARA